MFIEYQLLLSTNIRKQLYLVENPTVFKHAIYTKHTGTFTPMSFAYSIVSIVNNKYQQVSNLANGIYKVYEFHIKQNELTRLKPLKRLVIDFEDILDAVRYALILSHGLIKYFNPNLDLLVFKQANNVSLDNIDKLHIVEDIFSYIETYIDTTIVKYDDIDKILGVNYIGSINIKDSEIIDVTLPSVKDKHYYVI